MSVAERFIRHYLSQAKSDKRYLGQEGDADTSKSQTTQTVSSYGGLPPTPDSLTARTRRDKTKSGITRSIDNPYKDRSDMHITSEEKKKNDEKNQANNQKDNAESSSHFAERNAEEANNQNGQWCEKCGKNVFKGDPCEGNEYHH